MPYYLFFIWSAWRSSPNCFPLVDNNQDLKTERALAYCRSFFSRSYIFLVFGFVTAMRTPGRHLWLANRILRASHCLSHDRRRTMPKPRLCPRNPISSAHWKRPIERIIATAGDAASGNIPHRRACILETSVDPNQATFSTHVAGSNGLFLRCHLSCVRQSG